VFPPSTDASTTDIMEIALETCAYLRNFEYAASSGAADSRSHKVASDPAAFHHLHAPESVQAEWQLEQDVQACSGPCSRSADPNRRQGLDAAIG